jgi:hypothetical protein
MPIVFLSWLYFLAAQPGEISGPAAPSPPWVTAQRKPHDIGNCFQWVGCRGDSIGRMWVDSANICKSLGGKSWLDQNGRCHDLPAGFSPQIPDRPDLI